MKVSNLISKRSGESVRNQFTIVNNGKIYFQSYDSLIAEYDYNTEKLTVGRYFDYSVTTSKYLHQFIKENIWNIERLLQNYSGSYSEKIKKAIKDGHINYNENMQ